MATDKKSDYVGNHGGAYTDMDGMRKQFTYVDHDRNTTRLKSVDTPNPSVLKEIQKELTKYRNLLIERILAQPASLCPLPFQDFTVRGENVKRIEWNSDMIIDNGVPTDRLRDLSVLIENTSERLKLTH